MKQSKQSGRCDGWPVPSWRTLSAFHVLQSQGNNFRIYWLCRDEWKKTRAIKVMKYVCNCPAYTFLQINKTDFQVRDGSQEVVERVKRKKGKSSLPSGHGIYIHNLWGNQIREGCIFHPSPTLRTAIVVEVPPHFHVGTESEFHQPVRSLVLSIPWRTEKMEPAKPHQVSLFLLECGKLSF